MLFRLLALFLQGFYVTVQKQEIIIVLLWLLIEVINILTLPEAWTCRCILSSVSLRYKRAFEICSVTWNRNRESKFFLLSSLGCWCDQVTCVSFLGRIAEGPQRLFDPVILTQILAQFRNPDFGVPHSVHTVNPLLSPPFQTNPHPLINSPPFGGRKLISHPPLAWLFFTNKW